MTIGVLVGRGIGYTIGDRAILTDVDIRAEAGALCAVSGPSGAGKSTLLSVLAGLLSPSAGEVTMDGQPVPVQDVAWRQRVGIVLQGYGLVSALTAYENVAIILQSQRIPRAEVRERTIAVLAQVGLTEVADHLVEDLSGGQQQRAAVARSLVGRPDVIVADEPTSELDAENRSRIVELFAAAAAAGATVVLASHDPDVVDRCNFVVHLDQGRVIDAT